MLEPLPNNLLPYGVRSRFVEGINGLRMHVLEAGFGAPKRPGVLLLHGFPELAYSWRRILVPLAAAGFHAFAPDLRGYGRTTGWQADYDDDLGPFRRLNVVRDALGLVAALGHRSVAVIGHDFGSPIAGWCALVRPDVFTRAAMMSAPFVAPAPLPLDSAPPEPAGNTLARDLAALPRPRKHYQHYYQTREAGPNLTQAPQGVHAFLRAYYHHKSADWPGNQPHRLAARSAEEMAKMPTYYIMDAAEGMAETVAKHMPSAEEIAANRWLPDDELAVYAAEYERTGFQGGLNHYRSGAVGREEQELFAGRTLDQPTVFISGASDWGTWQSPGALERMRDQTCTDMRGVHLVLGAGHWVQQERAEETARLLVGFLNG